MSDKETRDYWSEGGQIFFHYGKAYGVAPVSQKQEGWGFLARGNLQSKATPLREIQKFTPEI